MGREIAKGEGGDDCQVWRGARANLIRVRPLPRNDCAWSRRLGIQSRNKYYTEASNVACKEQSVRCQ